MSQNLRVGRDGTAAVDRIGKCHVGDRTETVADHAPEHTVRDQLNGTHAELLERQGAYARLHQAQSQAVGNIAW